MQKPTSILSPSLYTKRHRGMKITIFTHLFSRKILTASTQGNATKFASSNTSKEKNSWTNNLREGGFFAEDFSKAVAKDNYKHTIPDSLYQTSSRNKNDNIHQFIFQKNPNRLNRKETPQNSQHSKPARKKTAGAVNLREGGFF